ncbi:MAG TPA: rhodanese-like domain-containing protein [Candidatus Limnocylindria bacterium]|nr:rhodanese-like domain-containing protein [Candidatus Limnocylindria bacterium]
MAHAHSPGFLALVRDAKSRVRELSIPEYRERVARGERIALVDVREDREWEKGHLPGAVHLGKGIVERDIEQTFPDKATPLVCYCGGGFRSALVCDNLQRMGYTHVVSLDGGFRGWTEAGLPIESDRGSD